MHLSYDMMFLVRLTPGVPMQCLITSLLVKQDHAKSSTQRMMR